MRHRIEPGAFAAGENNAFHQNVSEPAYGFAFANATRTMTRNARDANHSSPKPGLTRNKGLERICAIF